MQMTSLEAIKTRTRCFESMRGCKICGGYARYCASWTETSVFCSTCYPDGVTTVAKVNSIVNKTNKAIQKAIKSNWGIPVVFGGYNTK